MVEASAVESSATEDNTNMKKSDHRWPWFLFGIVILVLVATIAALATLFALERRQNTSQQQNIATKVDDDLCLTPYCIKAAANILDSIDETVDPCDDFYQFACGSWIRKAHIPNYESTHDYISILQTRLIEALAELLGSPSSTSDAVNALSPVINARRLYDSCMNESLIEEEGTEFLLSLINEQFGGWPVLRSSTWNEKSFQFSDTLLRINQFSNCIFFCFDTSIHDQNSSIISIRIGQAELPLLDRTYYSSNSSTTAAYLSFMREITEALNDGSEVDEKYIEEMFQLERKIAQHHATATEQRLNTAITVYTTVGNLSSELNTTFDFLHHLRQFFLLENLTLHDSDPVTLTELTYLRNVSRLIEEESPRTLQNYLIWLFVKNQVKFLPKKFRSIQQRFKRIFSGIDHEPARSSVCATFVNDKMGMAVSKLYLEKYFDRTARSQALDMIENIRQTFVQMINQSAWMDHYSKGKAMEKARAIGQKIGYPPYLDDEKDEKFYEDYAEYQFNKSLIRNALLILQLEAEETRKLLRKPLDRTSWFGLSPTVVNAFYFSSLNDIFFPAAILQPPFFHKEAPKYLNYGGIGTVIGHEITHGFDDEGRRFDVDGNKVSWWTDETVDNFNERAKCIVDQYSNYTMEEVNEKIRGEQTQGENIADIGGLKEAFLSYQQWAENSPDTDKKLPGLTQYSPEQLFFMNFAQLYCVKMTDQAAKRVVLTDFHAPHRFRVLGTTSNLPAFDRVFSCQPGQKNSRINKCAVW